MSFPMIVPLKAHPAPVATAGNDLLTPVEDAPFAGVVTSVKYTPERAQAGANTNSRTLTLYNRGQDGLGTTVVAQLALVSGVNLVDNVAKDITLSATLANRNVALGDVLEWESLHIGTGIVDPGGYVKVLVSRS